MAQILHGDSNTFHKNQKAIGYSHTPLSQPLNRSAPHGARGGVVIHFTTNSVAPTEHKVAPTIHNSSRCNLYLLHTP